MARTRLFIIDPNSALIEAIYRLLAESNHVQVIGGELRPEAAGPKLAQLQPDVVLIDLVHSNTDTLQFIKQLKSAPNAPQVVVMSLYDAPPYERAARAGGADAFVSKAELITELEPLIVAMMERGGSLGRNNQPNPNRVAYQAGDIVNVQAFH